MGLLKDFVNELYAKDPGLAVRFVNRTNRLVKIGRHWWRGYRKMTDGVVEVSGRTVGEGAATKPSWKLLPKEVAAEFSAFEKSVDDLVSSMCVTASDVDGDSRPLVFGGGVYAVDVNHWPTLNLKLKALQGKWDEAANKWCTPEGYKKFHEAVRDQVGTDEYGHVEKLIPKAEVLRSRFWLEVTPLTFQLSERVGDPDEDRGRRTAVGELIEAAVKGPRDAAAAAWRGLAGQLVTVENGTVVAHRPTRKNRDGSVSQTNRRVLGASVVNARAALEGLNRCARFHDPDMIAAADAVRAETSEDPGTAAQIAKTLGSDDAEAVRVANVLIAAADVAADEARMCAGVGTALTGV